MNIPFALAAANTVAATEEASLNIDSIKEAMDAFDPAAILPEMDSILDKVAIICRIGILVGPVILLALGLAYLLLSPREANYYFGYRCYFGMGSVNAWRFTQRIAGILMGASGLILTIVMYLESQSFAGMESMDMVWKAVRCLIWEAGVAAIVMLAINLTAMICYDRKGELRRKKNA